MLRVDIVKDVGDLNVAMFTFEKAGDILPKHKHTERDTHITIVSRGRIKAYSHDWEIEASAGQLLNFRAGEPHELMALEDNTRTFNVIKKYGGVMNENGYIDDKVPNENILNSMVEIV